jgi:hypothetical protein
MNQVLGMRVSFDVRCRRQPPVAVRCSPARPGSPSRRKRWTARAGAPHRAGLAEGTTIRDYRSEDWDAIAAAHDATRLQELTASVGVAAFKDLAATAEEEGRFDDQAWVAVVDGAVVGFVAFADEELTWLYVGNDAFPATGHVMERRR